MNDVITLLKPRVWSFRSRIVFKGEKGKVLKHVFLGGIGALFWGGIFVISLRVLKYFKGIEEIGDLIAFKLLSMMLVIIFSLLIFSSILTTLSKLYLSRDLPLVHSLPVSGYKIFIARWIESTIDSSWMVMLYTFPIFLSYGIVYQSGLFYYINMALALFPLAMIASGISALLVMLAVMFIPASRIRGLFIFLGLSLFIVLYIAVRVLRPERLVDPEAFVTVLVYLKALKAPALPYLPSTWAFDSIRAMLSDSFADVLFHNGLAWSGAFTMIFALILMADRIYFRGLSRVQTAQGRLFKLRLLDHLPLWSYLSGPVRAFAVKEVKTFFRDQTQWSQIFLIGALVLIYIYNFRVLPLEKSPIKTVYLQNLLSFLNMGLVSFVLIAITARFAYPGVSIEKEAFWLVRSAPIKLKTYLNVKFFIYLLPLLVLSEILIIGTNILLKVTPFMMMLSVITIFFMVPGVVSMGVGLGAAYPDFKSENPSQAVTGFGGLVFMMLSAVYIGAVIILEAGPVYNLFMANIHGRSLSVLEWVWIIGSFTVAFILSLLMVIIPMKFGERRLSRHLI